MAREGGVSYGSICPDGLWGQSGGLYGETLRVEPGLRKREQGGGGI